MITLPSIIDGESKDDPLVNCLRNQYRHLRKWAKRTATDALRLYDRDIHHYPVAIDLYAGRFCVHYYAQASHLAPPDELRSAVSKAIGQLFGVDEEAIYWRTRAKHKISRQYEKLNEERHFFNVAEYGISFRVNLSDYLDTGLFLDHRETRQLFAKEARGKHILNLFAYTCAFSVHAAVAGAASTTSVDMSNTYSRWGRANLDLNGIPHNHHRIIRADCLKFLDEELRSGQRYDLMIIDPPTLSRSKKMEQLFDLCVDYVQLLKRSIQLLTPQGVIYFSCNARKLAFDLSLFPQCHIQEITAQTVAMDFVRSPLHRCWRLQLNG
jgi:23S rRNA (cytosine1962-C5)-methyltransferase